MRSIHIFFIILALLTNCANLIDREKEPVIRGSFVVKEAENNYNITQFSYRADVTKRPIVLFDPLFISKESIYSDDSNEEGKIINALVHQGYMVFYISPQTTKGIDLKKIGKEILPKAFAEISLKTGQKEFYLGGLSLGGQAVYHYLVNKKTSDNPFIVKAFFIGTGIDYGFPGSFLERAETAGYMETDLSTVCAPGNTNTFCTRYIPKTKIDGKEITWVSFLPKLEKEPVKTFFDSQDLNYPIMMIFGKLDSISPDESIFPAFLSLGSKTGNKKKRFIEISEANGKSKDYDQADLFLNPEAPSDVYQMLGKWLEE